MEHNILILEPDHYSPKAVAVYQKIGEVRLGLTSDFDRSRVSVLVIRLKHFINKDFLNDYKKLECIVTPTTGLTHVDLDVCRKRGIKVFSLRDCPESVESITSTSELTFGLVLALLRKIPEAHQDVVHRNKWQRDHFRSRQLSELTLGIVGLGRIGGYVAGYAHAFGMEVYAYDPHLPSKRFEQLGVHQQELVSLMQKSDIVSLHADLRSDNHCLLGKTELEAMRSDALLVNTARGELLDEHFAADQLRQGKLGGIAVDVLADEYSQQPWEESPLLRASLEGLNVIITPHIGGCTSDAMALTEIAMAEYAQRNLKGVV